VLASWLYNSLWITIKENYTYASVNQHPQYYLSIPNLPII